eukprot:513814-Pyramimonas_sp.AAC.1
MPDAGANRARERGICPLCRRARTSSPTPMAEPWKTGATPISELVWVRALKSHKEWPVQSARYVTSMQGKQSRSTHQEDL